MNDIYPLLNEEGKKTLDILKDQLKLSFEKDSKPIGLKIQYKSDEGVVSIITLGEWEDD